MGTEARTRVTCVRFFKRLLALASRSNLVYNTMGCILITALKRLGVIKDTRYSQFNWQRAFLTCLKTKVVLSSLIGRHIFSFSFLRMTWLDHNKLEIDPVISSPYNDRSITSVKAMHAQNTHQIPHVHT